LSAGHQLLSANLHFARPAREEGQANKLKKNMFLVEKIFLGDGGTASQVFWAASMTKAKPITVPLLENFRGTGVDGWAALNTDKRAAQPRDTTP
jgi:hypothetical protein